MESVELQEDHGPKEHHKLAQSADMFRKLVPQIK